MTTLKTAGEGMDMADRMAADLLDSCCSNRKEAAAMLRAQAVEIEQLKRARDLALKRMQESTAYCIELRERLNKYEPGAAMILNAAIQKETP